VEFAKAGLRVTGVDISDGMIARAQDRLCEQPAEIRQRIDLMTGDVAHYRSAQVFDAVVSLFHVVDYQTTDEALAGIFATARRALGDHGVFVFDFWHGPAVLAQRPQRRQKRVESSDLTVTRIAEPVLHACRNIVAVQYTLTVENGDGKVEEIRECHAMRYLFPAEIEQFAAAAGFDIVESGAWLGGPPSEFTWSAYAAARSR
jgi:SAM-dependent methyltransferase